MKHFGLQWSHLVQCERVSLGKHTLGTCIGINAISVLEIHRMAALEASHFDVSLAEFLHFGHLALANFGHQFIVYVMWELAHASRHIE